MGVLTTATIKTFAELENRRQAHMWGRTSKGVLWCMVYAASQVEFFHSEDDGVSWTEDTGAELTSGAGNGAIESNLDTDIPMAMFVDVDNNIWLVGQGPTTNSANFYKWGTLNAAHTAITWTTNGPETEDWYKIDTGIGRDEEVANRPDLVVTKGGTDLYYVHGIACIGGNVVSNTFRMSYQRAKFDLSAVPGSEMTIEVSNGVAWSMDDDTDDGWPTIDFHHKGDEKTVKDALPHIYIYGKDASPGDEQAFMEVTASSLSAWDTVGGSNKRSFSAAADVTRPGMARWDGKRHIMVSQTEGSNNPPNVYERDAADSSWTDNTPSVSPSSALNAPMMCTFDPLTEDITLWSLDRTNDDLYFARYVRKTDTWSAWTLHDAGIDIDEHLNGGGVGSIVPVFYKITGSNTLKSTTEVFPSSLGGGFGLTPIGG